MPTFDTFSKRDRREINRAVGSGRPPQRVDLRG